MVLSGHTIRVLEDGVRMGSGDNGGGLSVNCWMGAHCLVINGKGDAIEIDDAGVVKSQFVDSSLISGSCTESGWCVAVGFSGLAYRHMY
jgi:hypothetical protein